MHQNSLFLLSPDLLTYETMSFLAGVSCPQNRYYMQVWLLHAENRLGE